MPENGTQAGPISRALETMLGQMRGVKTWRQPVISGMVCIDQVRFGGEALARYEGLMADVRYSVPLGETVLVTLDDGQSVVVPRLAEPLDDSVIALRCALDALRPKPETIDYAVDHLTALVSVRGTQLYVSDVAVPHLSVSRLDHGFYSVVCDSRFEKLFTTTQLEEFGYFLGQCMAVAAGYTCCGENSRPKQRNLFAPLFPAALAPEPGEPDRRSGLLRDVLREAENNPGHVLSADLLEGIVHELEVAGPVVAAVLDPDVKTIHADMGPVELIVFGLLTMHAPSPLHIEYIDNAVDLGQNAEDGLVFEAVDRLVERGLVAYEGGAGLVRLAGGES